VAPLLAAAGYRVIVPHLRGHGTTRFLSSGTFRNAQQSVVALDIIDLMDALKIEKAILAGYDWGARTANIIAALWPERCKAMVSVNGYLINNLERNKLPLPPKAEWGWWYQYYFATERGRAGLDANRRDLAKLIWKFNSPKWDFDDTTFNRTAASFDNPDYVSIVIHNYRWRLSLAEGDPQYDDLEKRLAEGPVIAVPTITLDGDSDGVAPATDGTSYAMKFSGKRAHRMDHQGHRSRPAAGSTPSLHRSYRRCRRLLTSRGQAQASRASGVTHAVVTTGLIMLVRHASSRQRDSLYTRASITRSP
jgi:pimeloyl-ACP methyl ester carboxylesterase